MQLLTRFISLAFLATTLASCSLGFGHTWRKTAAHDGKKPPTDLSGAWEGTWNSEKSGHHGTLKAVVTRVPGSGKDVDYDFRYHATWARILSGGYTSRHTVSPKGTVTGEQDLGKLLGGVYHYHGQASPTHFKAKYTCSIDHGVFEMHRPAVKR